MSERWDELDIDELLRSVREPEPEALPEQPAAAAARAPGRHASERARAASEKPPARKTRPAPAAPPPEKPPAGRASGRAPAALCVLLALVGIMLVCWLGANAHIAPPAAAAAERSDRVADLAGRFDGFMNNAKSDAVSGLTYIRKIYTIPENDTVAPEPDVSNYLVTTDKAQVRALIDSAAMLLDGQDTLWNEDIELLPGASFTCYLDETIMVVTWKELINGKACTCAEVRIADASQLRRKITGDSYDSGIRQTALELAEQTNAVLASNADFYSFRPMGITVYQRTLYRWVGEKIDTCFFTASGDMLMTEAGYFSSREETERFIEENDVLFSTSFGPILVKDGELRKTTSYPVGEIDSTYSRSAIGMTDELHYFIMTINYEPTVTVAATVHQLGEIMYLKGCRNAYTLDGGQTSELCMNGATLNHVDWGAERPVSDIIYFATALPQERGLAQ